MESSYCLVSKDICVPLFKLGYEYKNEGPAIIDFRIKMSGKRDLVAEDTIRDIYSKFRGRHDSVSNPIELLGILLANGFSLRLQKDEEHFDLCKDYFPISFVARSQSQIIRLGDYYRTSTSSIGEQFICFGRWLDHLTGFKGMNRQMVYQFISAGLSIVAREFDKETVLVSVNARGDILDGEAAVLAELIGEET